ncbi:hypothetical protein Smp_134580 [Schistosoma mansoni]|uniref:hypothetical protein n=1 Tax=Schistosoma mansoni TaxID=6183 RepID=UPI00022DC06F|nr:hypothetical protein Smp_134580 [Schistosoma mansoni]|eukprot:XP_018653641.1 hypothetical protein Smp_134580 [Schistosoma mansoni]
MIQDSEPQKLLSSNVDPVKSSAMQKKIRQKYFKNDAVIKAYKCDLMSQNINTPVKLYVCHSALNLVHRPKRRILTALLFSQIVELKVQNEHSVNIHTTSNETYTLANFERSDSAIAFLRNYWEVILKEKASFYCFSPSYGSSPANRLFVNNNTTNNNNNTNDLLTHPNAIISDLYNRLLISKGSTTVSLTSTSGGATGSISNSETESVVGVKKQESSIRKFSLGVCKPSLIEFNHLNKETTNQNINIGSNDVIQHNDNSNVTNPIVNNGLNNCFDLVYLILVIILGFLFLSTIHLYHRLALIDLQTGPTIRRAGIHQQSSTTSNSELHNLEAQLTYLTQLTSKMIETLGYLTSELNSFVLYSNPEKFSPDQSTLNT